MGFRAVQKGSHGSRSKPQLTIYADGNARLTAAADELLDTPPAVRVLVGDGADAGWLALEPSDDHHDHYAISRDEDRRAGGDLSLKTTLRDAVGVDPDGLEATQRLDISQDGERVLVDLREHPAIDIGSEADESEASDAGDENDDTTAASDEEVQAAVDGGAVADSSDETVELPEPDVEREKGDTPPWRQGERDRRERVHLYVAAMVNELGTLKSTYADIAEQVGHPDAHGNSIRYDLQAMDGYEATEYEDPEDGPTVWRIAKTDDSEDTDPDEQDAATQDDDPDLLEGVISAEGDDGEVELPADEVVDAIASAEDVHDVQVALGLDRVGVRLLLQELDMHDMLAKGQDGVHQDVVRETVAGYLEVQDA